MPMALMLSASMILNTISVLIVFTCLGSLAQDDDWHAQDSQWYAHSYADIADFASGLGNGDAAADYYQKAEEMHQQALQQENEASKNTQTIDNSGLYSSNQETQPYRSAIAPLQNSQGYSGINGNAVMGMAGAAGVNKVRLGPYEVTFGSTSYGSIDQLVQAPQPTPKDSSIYMGVVGDMTGMSTGSFWLITLGYKVNGQSVGDANPEDLIKLSLGNLVNAQQFQTNVEPYTIDRKQGAIGQALRQEDESRVGINQQMANYLPDASCICNIAVTNNPQLFKDIVGTIHIQRVA